MAFDGAEAYAFTPEGVREGAPMQSGVYGIYNPSRWIFIGDSDNMQGALFDKLNSPNDCIESNHPLSFSCQTAPPGERGSIRDALIAELRPTCNS